MHEPSTHRSLSMALTTLAAACTALFLAGCASQPGAAGTDRSVTIERTTYGIPHITANDPESLAYGVAYAYAQDNVCMTADQLVTARGQRSSTFGAQTIGLLGRRYIPNAQIDLFMAAHMDDAMLERAWAQTSAETQALARGYVAGYNRFLTDNAATLPEACRGKPWVQPMTLAQYRRMAEVVAVQAGIAALADGMLGALPPAACGQDGAGTRCRREPGRCRPGAARCGPARLAPGLQRLGLWQGRDSQRQRHAAGQPALPVERPQPLL